ncbi:UDP-glycosyltransferase 83A1-like [Salvia miltiorrhiza]|uniref:UDP-glycosyltransferase 83A1-like n=1 Tax=Salvia miltiorrhiza TaxID=226208 RepID=UPI0025AB8BF1|nr:UDP-glycosyltransferase 83A1-like [Salvia miltiorrhiza]
MTAVSGNGHRSHVLAVPLPAQGHVKPLMSLCRQIAKHGIKVTFVNAQSIHHKILSAAAAEEEDDDCGGNVVMATVPDGLSPEHDPNNPFMLFETLQKTMPQTLPELIERINSDNPNEKVTCLIADLSFSWIFDIADKMGLEPVGFSPPSVACLAMAFHALKMLERGDLDTNGSLKNGDVISLSDDTPAWRNEELPWRFPDNPKMEKVVIEAIQVYRKASKAKWWLCNSCYELEPAANELLPNALPIGPLNLLDSITDGSDSRSTNFYPEHSSCLSWLDSKPDGSVVYVSFGSSAVFSQKQLDELALGLELSGRAFLWVVRPDLVNGSCIAYPDGFLDRVSGLGKIVEWAPQNRVLAHPSIGCFMSHCGWNSTMEGASRGVPFLCWPYMSDQLHNERYICDKWEIGLKITFDEGGIKSRYEIKKKIETLFSDNKFKENALKLKEMCGKSVSIGGSSCKNMKKFIDHLRG